MTTSFERQIAIELGIKESQIKAVVALLEEGSTIPFMARYRKEKTGSLDEAQLTNIRDRLHQLRELSKRRETVLNSIKEQGKLTEALKEKIMEAKTLAVLEDVYLPYKPKRRTRATIAKEKGLETLAKMIYQQEGIDPVKEAAGFVDVKKKVGSVDEALAGARDIMAEWINENTRVRSDLRRLYKDSGVVRSRVIKGKEKAGMNFKDYFEWDEQGRKAPSHRILAVRRGEKEGFLSMRVAVPEGPAIALINKHVIKGHGPDTDEVKLSAEDSWKRLLSASLETEYRLSLKKRADEEAVQIFKNNLKELLMASPLGKKSVMAIDPGLRTGCKLICLDSIGNLLEHTTIYTVGSKKQIEESKKVIKEYWQKYKSEVIAVGNGTASKETLNFVKNLELPEEIPIIMASESGASIYSASDAAREEFPDLDVTIRGAISIGRRLMDPLAELVKIDPKNIGVGQYQHDVDQKLLKQNLDDAVISCVNQVGVEINTASRQLLMYVSGLGPTRAKAIIEYRNQHGAFQSREELKKVSQLGSKAFEQAAGFLRIHDGHNPLDASAVHPESYPIVDQMAKGAGCSLKELLSSSDVQEKLNLNEYISDAIGLPTLIDIKQELVKPGRDPREAFQLFTYREDVNSIQDLAEGMKLPGVVTNITAFGAFVDIGVHHDGLIHISELSHKFVKDPHQVVKVHQKVDVTVLKVDFDRQRIALSMKY